MIKKYTTLLMLSLTTASGCSSWHTQTITANYSLSSHLTGNPKLTIGPIHPWLGISFSEFSALTQKGGYGSPRAVTSKNRLMVYNLPYQQDIYFWFDNQRLIRITQTQADDPNSWQTHEINPSASTTPLLF